MGILKNCWRFEKKIDKVLSYLNKEIVRYLWHGKNIQEEKKTVWAGYYLCASEHIMQTAAHVPIDKQ